MLRRLLPFAWGLACLPAFAAAPASTGPAKPPAKVASAAAPVSAAPVLTPIPSPTASGSAPIAPTPFVDPETLDSVDALTLRPIPDPAENLPPFLQHVEYLRQHHDEAMAAGYLQNVIVDDVDISPPDRARAILELADCLQVLGRQAETLCWLKIWMGLYSGRTETAAVAYRMGKIYTQMGLPSLARDSYYLALSFAINQGQVQDADDLRRYQRLTNGTLWALADNEYHAGEWARAAELFDRYRREAPMASAASLETATYLQADCYYQLRQNDKAAAAYVEVLDKHPFHPLAPEARLRLYHLDVLAGQPAKAQQELQALVWTVRTVWPEREAYWQKRTAELLLALNRKSGSTLPPLLLKSARLQAEDKTWQGELDHYDRLAKFEAATMRTIHPQASAPSAGATLPGLREQDDLSAMQRSIDELAPPKIASPVVAANPP
jgi:tetratricopeptide (TPR) repeat protein